MSEQAPNDPQDIVSVSVEPISQDHKSFKTGMKVKQEKTNGSDEGPSKVPDLDVEEGSLVRPENS